MKIEDGILVDMDYEEKNLVFPKEMRAIDTEIEEGGFLLLTNVESIAAEEGNPFYHSEGNCLIDTAQKRLILGCKNSVIPEGIELIEYNAFSGCTLDQATLPEGLIAIGGHAFAETDIQSLTIPKSVEMICPGAFFACTKLRRLEVHPDNPVYRSANNCIIEKETNTLVACCHDPVVPDGVEIIGEQALSLENTRYITLPDSVKEIRKFFIDLPPHIEFGSHEEMDENGKPYMAQAVIRAPKGSYAISFAIENSLPYEEI